ncbi:alpha/beta hydrolase [Olivibacter sp. SDN3]|uniref:alpha/beta fold hydrolase n=1 Tax=Olivibacter sp. SDN3 TaxID=2764720 RepID=UPI0016516ABA|nr:alpha/beta hydrolase [Olivibacter sp. SDN3]QNL50961.1 alpha/beta hydrolase [Olivibacter sp. SDN3]
MDTILSNFTHGMADINPSLRLHYVSAGEGNRVIVLLHGFPQTWWEWRHIIPGLTEAGFRVIVPDYRGAGDSWKPQDGYDKKTMARDIHTLLKSHLRIDTPVIIGGHDIGLMVAYAFAQQYRNDTSHLIVMDAPLPGTTIFNTLRSDQRVWHFAFHQVLDLPEALVNGREHLYLQFFFNARIYNPAAISQEDLQIYIEAYKAPGAMRAGFELYRNFDQDEADNRQLLKRHGKLNIPVLAVGGETSTSGPLMDTMMREVAEDVTGLRIPRSAHWVAEENPTALLRGTLQFLQDIL